MGRSSSWKKPFIGMAICLLFAGGMVDIYWIDTIFPPRCTDFVSVELGMKATLHGQNAYSDRVTRQIQTVYYGKPLSADSKENPMAYVYPAYTAVLLAPLALLPASAAHVVLMALLPLLALAAAVLWLAIAGFPVGNAKIEMRAAIAGAFMASWPVLWAVRLEQPTLMVAFLLALGCWLVQTADAGAMWKDVAAGLVFSAAAIKPQLAGPLTLWLAAWTMAKRRGVARIHFAAAFAAGAGGLLAASNRLVPGWFPLWRSASTHLLRTHQKPELVAAFGAAGWVLMAALVVFLMMALHQARNNFAASCALVLAATVALLPGGYAMAYNHVLLLPGIVLLLMDAERGILRSIALGLVGWQYALIAVVALVNLLAPVPSFWAALYLTTLLPSAVALALGQQMFGRSLNRSQTAAGGICPGSQLFLIEGRGARQS